MFSFSDSECEILFWKIFNTRYCASFKILVKFTFFKTKEDANVPHFLQRIDPKKNEYV